MIFNIAHRGASGYEAENTMEAFEKAIELGCDGIETDVQLSKDGIPVLIHDETVDRTTTSSGFVKDFTCSELRDMGIPSLEQLMILVRLNHIILNLELKNGIVLYKELEEKVITIIKKYHMEQRVILSSFNHESMVKCKQIDASIMTGLLYIENLVHPEKYCKYVGADALHPNYRVVNKKMVEAAHEQYIKVNVYTVNEEEDIQRMIELEVDMVITNYPDRVRKYL